MYLKEKYIYSTHFGYSIFRTDKKCIIENIGEVKAGDILESVVQRVMATLKSSYFRGGIEGKLSDSIKRVYKLFPLKAKS